MQTLSQYFISKKYLQTGEIGIEVEVEGSNLPPQLRYYWERISDGSLRGESCEYIFKKAFQRKTVGKALAYLEKKLSQDSTRVFPSPRTSVHVHVNVQDLSMTQVHNFILLYLLYETFLIKLCGEERAGNFFCLQNKDAEFISSFLAEMEPRARVARASYHTDELRYAALNINALSRFGSLEFRGMEGTIEAERISSWVSILLKLKDASRSFTNPSEMFNQLSLTGAHPFTEQIFQDDFNKVFTEDNPLTMSKLHENIWRLQEIAYLVDWKAVMEEERKAIQYANKHKKYKRPETSDTDMHEVHETIASSRVELRSFIERQALERATVSNRPRSTPMSVTDYRINE